jgi:hypothetical protein
VNHRRYHFVITVNVALILLLVAWACEPAVRIRIQNQTDQVLSIFIGGYSGIGDSIGNVAPGAEIRSGGVLMYDPFRIEAKNAQGEVVYSKQFSFEELNRKMNWTVIIKPSDLKKS